MLHLMFRCKIWIKMDKKYEGTSGTVYDTSRGLRIVPGSANNRVSSSQLKVRISASCISMFAFKSCACLYIRVHTPLVFILSQYEVQRKEEVYGMVWYSCSELLK